jgi:hypothetical protein
MAPPEVNGKTAAKLLVTPEGKKVDEKLDQHDRHV